MAITKVTNSLVATNAIQGTLIADNAITSVHIAQNQVTAVQIPDGSITATQLGANSVDSSELVDGSIDTSHIADAQITTAKLGTNQVTSAKIAQNSVEARHIADGSITDTQLGSGAFTMGNITTTGSIRGPASLTIDPATVGDNTGTVVIAGNLQVDGTTTTVNSTTLNVADKNITLGNGGSASANNGGGITIDGAAATMLYTHSTTSFDFNKPVNVTGAFSASGNITGTLATAAQTNITSVGTLTALIGGTGDLNWDSGTLFVDSSANRVGIGTTSPSQKLDVAGNLKLSDGYIEFDKPNVKGFRFLQNDTGNDLSIQQGDTNNANYVTKFNINTSGNATFAGTINTTGLTAQTGGTAGIADVVSFNASGNGGSGRGTGILIKAAGSSSAVSVARIVGLQETAASTANNASLAFQVAASNGTLTERMRIDASGKVNIGGTTMSGLLNIQTASSSVAPQIEFRNTAAGAQIGMPANTNALSFHTADSERLRIDASGSVLINETNSSPSNIGTHYLVVQRSTSLNGGAAFGMNTGGDVASRQQVTFFNANGTVGSIFTNGSATAYNTSSDYRLKENVNYTFNALDRVAQLKPARFNFIADADTTVDGFIAHEVQDIIPEAVSGEKDGEQMQGMDYGRITPLLVKAIQEQQALIESLTARIETLEE